MRNNFSLLPFISSHDTEVRRPELVEASAWSTRDRMLAKDCSTDNIIQRVAL
jgi:hypothetical protein